MQQCDIECCSPVPKAVCNVDTLKVFHMLHADLWSVSESFTGIDATRHDFPLVLSLPHHSTVAKHLPQHRALPLLPLPAEAELAFKMEACKQWATFQR